MHVEDAATAKGDLATKTKCVDAGHTGPCSSEHASTESLIINTASFENLVKAYTTEVAQMTEFERINQEAKLVRALCRVLYTATVQPPGIMEAWLTAIGLRTHEIQSVCQFTNLDTLFTSDEKGIAIISEQCSLPQDSRRRLRTSAIIVRGYLQEWHAAHGEPGYFTDKQLSWSLSAGALLPNQSGLKDPLLSPVGERARYGASYVPPSSSLNTIASAGEFAKAAADVQSPGELNLNQDTRRRQSPLSPVAAAPTLNVSTTGRAMQQSASMQFAPRSPRDVGPNRLLHHAIPHVWQKKSSWRISDSTCSLCRRPLGSGFLNSYEKCRSCRWRVHTHCKSRVGDSCGLTSDHLKAILDDMIVQSNWSDWGRPASSALPNSSTAARDSAFQYPDPIGDSSSSTNSSAPSTPALLNIGQQNSPYLSAANAVPQRPERNFTFPDSVPEVPDIVLAEPTDDPVATTSSDHIGSEGSHTIVQENIRPESLGTIDSYDSEEPPTDDKKTHTWDRSKWTMKTFRDSAGNNSWQEMYISMKNIKFNDDELEKCGRFGKVLKGHYYGEVAVKFCNMDHVEPEKRVDEFKNELASFKKARHDNIAMVMGLCLDEPNLAFVTEYSKGESLFKIIHGDNLPLEYNLVLHHSVQILQGLSYLHTRKLIHKDLRSRNVFVEPRGKTVITDIGLMSMARLRLPERRHAIFVPRNWIASISPELIIEIKSDFHELMFSEESDVYAFGTILYEMICGIFPWSGIHPDEVIYRVGCGFKAPLVNDSGIEKEFKDILLRAWSYNIQRPSAPELLSMFASIPRRPFARHPTNFRIRSRESSF